MVSSVMFPQATVQSGLPGMVTSQGSTRIRFPAPGEVSPSRPKPAPETAIAHTNSFGFAYANDIARVSVALRTQTTFAPGSIIVREKLWSSTANPEVLVVMVKREMGFNPKASDWEFLTVSGDLKRIEQREKEGKCQRCHASEAKHDFVFRYPTP